VTREPGFSIQGLYRLDITRNSLVFSTFIYERTGALAYSVGDTSRTVLERRQHYFFLQENLLFAKYFIIGIGYKAFAGNYGMLNWRFTLITGRNKRLSLGYSFDTRRYIRNDKIRYNSSHELSLRYKLPSNQ